MKETEIQQARIFIVLSICPSEQHIAAFKCFVLTAFRTFAYLQHH
jgi:hypothetical protein